MTETMPSLDALAELRAVDPKARLWSSPNNDRIYFSDDSFLAQFNPAGFACDAVWAAVFRIVAGRAVPEPKWPSNVPFKMPEPMRWKVPEDNWRASNFHRRSR